MNFIEIPVDSILRLWTRSTTINPLVNHYVTRDQQRIFTCCLDPKKDWPNLCHALGRLELIDHSHFATPELRRAHGPELVGIIDAVVAGKDLAEWGEIFRQHGVIWSLVPNTQQVAADPQMEANGVYAEIEPGLRTVMNPLTLAGEAEDGASDRRAYRRRAAGAWLHGKRNLKPAASRSSGYCNRNIRTRGPACLTLRGSSRSGRA
jgi:crotonobetainyl-CoA:carnitine CoA-transferase CaiB-like acyl-CoA transferase